MSLSPDTHLLGRLFSAELGNDVENSKIQFSQFKSIPVKIIPVQIIHNS